MERIPIHDHDHLITYSVFEKLSKKGLTIAFSESITGGAIVYEMVKIEGASRVLKGSLVTYQRETKTRILDILESTIEHIGIVSEAMAILMARKTKERMGSDIAVGITGNAGPMLQGSLQEEAWYAILIEDQVYTYHIRLGKIRISNIQTCVDEVYRSLDKLIG